MKHTAIIIAALLIAASLACGGGGDAAPKQLPEQVQAKAIRGQQVITYEAKGPKDLDQVVNSIIPMGYRLTQFAANEYDLYAVFEKLPDPTPTPQPTTRP